MEEKVLETKPCRQCGISFAITDKDRKFLDKLSPVFAGKKYQIPDPTLCPDCRQQRRLCFRNERSLYHRNCDRTGNQIVSMYSPDKHYKIYDQKSRRTDDWNPLDYGKEIDWSTSIITQFDVLLHEVPIISLKNTSSQNSEYANLSGYMKDCYLIFAGEYNENCCYGQRVMECKNCIDCLESVKCTNCYENIHTENCYDVFYAQNCKNCSQSYFLYDCEGCSNCLLCVGLRNTQYCIRNKQYDKDVYEAQKKNILSQGLIKLLPEFLAAAIQHPHKNLELIQTESIIGDYLFSAKNMYYGFDATQAEDCRYTYAAFKVKDLMDVTNTTEQEMAYESVSVGYNSIYCLFTYGGRTSNNLIYCFDCHMSSHLFACTGLRNASYCILNKQYTKEEYEQLIPQIIKKMLADGEWGEFFPFHVSPFGYNETVAMEYYPLNRNEALATGFNRSDYEAPYPKSDAEDAAICEVSGKPFRLITQELAFYNKYNLPLPTKHPDIRHAERMALRNPRKLRNRTCDKCGTEIKTSYAPERPEVVYCETCYNKEIY